MLNLIGKLAVPIAVLLTFQFARRYMPVPPRELDAQGVRDLSRLQWIVAMAMLGIGISFGFGSYKLIVWLNQRVAESGPGADFLLLPSKWIWFFFPLFGALSLSWEITFDLWSLLGDPSLAKAYAQWSNEKSGFNATRLLRWLAEFIAAPIGLATILAIPIHSSVTQRGVFVSRFGQFTPKLHAYKDARGLTVARGLRLRDGSFESRPAIVLDFADGYRWSSADYRDPEKGIDSKLLEFLKELTGLPVKEIDAFPFGKA